MNFWEEFTKKRSDDIKKMVADRRAKNLGLKFLNNTARYKYTYNFTWLGSPIIQFPQDMVAMQEIVWSVKPDLIIETGIAHGGSLIFYASLLELIGNKGKVIGIDIDIRKHNRREIEKHRMFKRIVLLQGSSIDPNIVQKVNILAKKSKKVLVALDSNHTHDHVLSELKFYSPMVTKGSYLVVFDTVIEDMPEDSFPDRPWNKRDNPKTAVREFLKSNSRFVVDRDIEDKLLITVAPGGYLKCVKD
jgi:cephalosporin hydroxylase